MPELNSKQGHLPFNLRKPPQAVKNALKTAACGLIEQS
jgi:hypothetical protein